MSFCIILYCNIAVKVLFYTQVLIFYEISSKVLHFAILGNRYSKKTDYVPMKFGWKCTAYYMFQKVYNKKDSEYLLFD